jgi:hypothetical protein
MKKLKLLHPAIKSLQKRFDVSGPFVPDAFWGNKTYKKFDMILGMYHDQVLIPFKLLNFNSGVNFTAGLKLIRTSPDHGTAFDIAGLNKANESSMLQSYKYAIKIFQNRKRLIAEKNLTDPYLHVSNIYPHLMDFISYKWWARYIYTITKNKVPKDSKVCWNLAGGNCALASHLIKILSKIICITDIIF